MGIIINKPPESLDDVFDLVSSYDPSVIAANDPEALAAYRADPEALSQLDVPADATIYQCRALSRQDIRAAEAKAGRRWFSGQQLITDARAAVEGAEDVDKAFAAALDAMSDDEAASAQGHLAWLSRRSSGLLRVSLLAHITDGDRVEFAPGAFDVDRFMDQVDAYAADGLAKCAEGDRPLWSALSGDAVVGELARHVEVLSQPGKARLHLSR